MYIYTPTYTHTLNIESKVSKHHRQKFILGLRRAHTQMTVWNDHVFWCHGNVSKISLLGEEGICVMAYMVTTLTLRMDLRQRKAWFWIKNRDRKKQKQKQKNGGRFRTLADFERLSFQSGHSRPRLSSAIPCPVYMARIQGVSRRGTV